ncbi:F-box and associated interaction domains-containing protein [Striga asiatica]|uniref:F-box and associated interaction domains-containing protein n=1 Tax=Striga asiatica TaxID=4170 RepID=A0A5A7NYC9_STRAF|nr:F-box and associated interaction domains-containing protein [Striga asiatica]
MRNRLLLMNLPANILAEILARLPAKSLAASKSVCKTWLELINTPYFISLHFSLSKPCLIVHHSTMFEKHFNLLDFHHSPKKPKTTAEKISFAGISPFPDSNIVIDASSNGFLFLRDINYRHETLVVCNPFTREYFELPRPNGLVRYPMAVTHGFGPSAKTGHHKIVRILHDRELNPRNRACERVPFSSCQVFNFRDRAWKTVIGPPARFVYNSRLVGVFLNGNVHWLVHDLEGFELISCFDLENERFTQHFPSPFPGGGGQGIWGSLGVLRGCLALCDNTGDWDIDVWIMGDYGVGKSWEKKIVIGKTMPGLVGPSFQIVHVIDELEDGSLLFVWGDFFMLRYSARRKVVEGVDLKQPKGPNSMEAIRHVPSLVSLNSFVPPENVCVY